MQIRQQLQKRNVSIQLLQKTVEIIVPTCQESPSQWTNRSQQTPTIASHISLSLSVHRESHHPQDRQNHFLPCQKPSLSVVKPIGGQTATRAAQNHPSLSVPRETPTPSPTPPNMCVPKQIIDLTLTSNSPFHQRPQAPLAAAAPPPSQPSHSPPKPSYSRIDHHHPSHAHASTAPSHPQSPPQHRASQLQTTSKSSSVTPSRCNCARNSGEGLASWGATSLRKSAPALRRWLARDFCCSATT